MPAALRADRFDIESLRGFLPSLRELKGIVNGRVELTSVEPAPLRRLARARERVLAIRGYGGASTASRPRWASRTTCISIKHASLNAAPGASA